MFRSPLVFFALVGVCHAFSPTALSTVRLPSQTRATTMKTALTMHASESSEMSRRNLLAATAGLAMGGVAFSSPVIADGGTTAIMKIKTAEGVEGDVTIQLFPDLAPKTVERFTTLAKEGLYDGTAFHRVAHFLKKNVLVGGDPFTKEEKYCFKDVKDKETCSEGQGYGPDGFFSSSLKQSRDDKKSTRATWDKGGPSKWRKDGLSQLKLEPEFGKIPHERGVISMRRFGAPESAGSQFIICLSDMQDEMDGQYAAFGKITSGIEVLDKMKDTAVWKSPAPMTFVRDDKKPEATWGAWDQPVFRQGVDKVTIQ